jgi:hypothetical protein
VRSEVHCTSKVVDRNASLIHFGAWASLAVTTMILRIRVDSPQHIYFHCTWENAHTVTPPSVTDETLAHCILTSLWTCANCKRKRYRNLELWVVFMPLDIPRLDEMLCSWSSSTQPNQWRMSRFLSQLDHTRGHLRKTKQFGTPEKFLY